MGYEVKAYIVDKYGIEMASVDLGKVYDEAFMGLFDDNYHISLYSMFGGMGIPEDAKEWYPNVEEIPDIKITEDKYGEELKSCSAEDMLEYLKAPESDNPNYKVLKSILKAYKKLYENGNIPYEFEGVRVVRFGY